MVLKNSRVTILRMSEKRNYMPEKRFCMPKFKKKHNPIKNICMPKNKFCMPKKKFCKPKLCMPKAVFFFMPAKNFACLKKVLHALNFFLQAQKQVLHA
jgi:hypothetical protein